MGRGRFKGTPNTRNRRPAATSRPESEAELERLRRELREARALLQEMAKAGPEGAPGVAARRIATLEEERQIARGHAVEASLARSRAEAELKALRDSIHKATGLQGWLLRRASRHLQKG